MGLDGNKEHKEKTETQADWLKELEEPGKKRQDSSKKLAPQPKLREELGKYVGMASELFGAVIVGALIGYWLDVLFDSKPWYLLGGMILGSLGGFWNIYKIIAMGEKEEAKNSPSLQKKE